MTNEMIQKPEPIRAFACRCDDKGREECDALIERAINELQVKDKANLVTAIIAELEWQYQIHEITIAYDQWGGIFATSASGVRIIVEFDRFEDGLARLWAICAEKPSGSLEETPGQGPESPG